MLFRNDSLFNHEDNNGLPYLVKLAEVDPDGNETDGILYHNGVELFGDVWSEEGVNSNSNDGVSASELASTVGWGSDVNGKKYLNCYIVNRIDGHLGGGIQAYAYFPTANIVYGNYNLYNTFGCEDLEDEYGQDFSLKSYTDKGLNIQSRTIT